MFLRPGMGIRLIKSMLCSDGPCMSFLLAFVRYDAGSWSNVP
jgi:hypothetical protein